MGGLAMDIGRETTKKSPIHSMDTRLVLLFTIALIIYAVIQTDLSNLLILEIFLLLLMVVANLSPGYVWKRLLLVFPFGGFIALMQPFIRPGEVIWSYGPLAATQQGLDIGLLLLAKLFVSVSAVILLSSTSTQGQIFNSLRTVKVPGVMVAILNMMARYIHIFDKNRRSMSDSRKARCFQKRGHPKGPMFVLRTLGKAIGSLFIRSFEQGERVFDAMVARGYTKSSKYRVLGGTGNMASGLVLMIIMAILIFYLEAGAVLGLPRPF